MVETTLNGHKWKVSLVGKDELPSGVLGRTYFDLSEIVIRKDLTKGNMTLTLLHELTHACLFSQGRVYQTKFTDEDLCEFMAWNAESIINACHGILEELEHE